MYFGLAASERVSRKGNDEDSENRFDNGFRNSLQEKQSKRDACQRGKHQPARTADMDIAPILNYDNGGHGNGHQNGERRRDLDWQRQREERNRDQGFAK